MSAAARTGFAVTVGLVAVLSLGCQAKSRVELTSFSDPYFPETFHFSPETCVYRNDGGGDCHVVAYSTSDAADANTATQQWLHIHVFWKPHPGKTRDNPTSMDAVVRYAIKTTKGTTLYAGTAFAYPSPNKPGERLKLSIESGRLHATSRSGDAPEMLGETRMSGTLEARADASAALDLMRQIDLVSGTSE